MFIYAIGTEDKQKIGVAGDPNHRLSALQTGNPEKLTIHQVIEVDDDMVFKFEKYIHKENNHKRLHGEWFEMSIVEVTSLMTYYDIMMETIIETL